MCHKYFRQSGTLGVGITQAFTYNLLQNHHYYYYLIRYSVFKNR